MILDNISITKLKKFNLEAGDVYHALKSNEDNFSNFGEAYFSTVNPGYIKGWKKHHLMTMNLIVPVGSVKFVFYDDVKKIFREETIGESNYSRITVPNKIWFAFQCISNYKATILNISDIIFDPEESINCDLSEFLYEWGND
tara:strand:+ start:902 stop:1327 length:426 start_codon:yes stop_codon:yes gene_type:complete